MPPETDLAVAIAKIESISGDMAEIKSSMKELATAVSRLAVIEERQTATNGAMERAFKEIADTNQSVATLNGRILSLEQAQPIQQQSSDFVQSAVKYLLVLVLGAFLSGLLPKAPTAPTQTPPAIVGK